MTQRIVKARDLKIGMRIVARENATVLALETLKDGRIACRFGGERNGIAWTQGAFLKPNAKILVEN